MRYVAIIASLLMLAACSNREEQQTPPDVASSPPAQEQAPAAPSSRPDLAGTAWRVADIDGTAVGADSKATLEFLDDGKVAGNGSCNRYGGPVEIADSSIRFGALISTKMACAAIEQEGRYFKALEETRGYRVDGRTLVLLDEKGAERVRLNAEDSEQAVASPTAFVNKVWAVKQSSTVAPGTLYVFLSDGTLVITSTNSKPALGTWNHKDAKFTMVEDGIPYKVDILKLTDTEFEIRSHNPGQPVEIEFAPASTAAEG